MGNSFYSFQNADKAIKRTKLKLNQVCLDFMLTLIDHLTVATDELVKPDCLPENLSNFSSIRCSFF